MFCVCFVCLFVFFLKVFTIVSVVLFVLSFGVSVMLAIFSAFLVGLLYFVCVVVFLFVSCVFHLRLLFVVFNSVCWVV